MKYILSTLLAAALLTGCSSVYKSGQTPDDVYYSAEKPRQEYTTSNSRNNSNYSNDDEYLDYRNDRYLRMKVRNRRWSALDYDDAYSYSPGGYSYYNSFYSRPWNSYSYFSPGYYYNPYNNFYGYNSYYNNSYYGSSPYYGHYGNYGYYGGNIIVGNSGRGRVNNNTARQYNLDVYNSAGSASTNSGRYNTGSSTNGSNTTRRTTSDGNYRNSGTDAGNFLRETFRGSSNSNNSGSNTGSSSSGSTSSGSSSSGSSSSGSSSSGSSGGGATTAPRRN